MKAAKWKQIISRKLYNQADGCNIVNINAEKQLFCKECLGSHCGILGACEVKKSKAIPVTGLGGL
jgi:hypothetical protein